MLVMLQLLQEIGIILKLGEQLMRLVTCQIIMPQGFLELGIAEVHGTIAAL